MGVVTEPVNQFNFIGSLQQGLSSPVVTSAGTMPAPVSSIYHVSGTTQITLMALPWPGFTGRITWIADAAVNWTTGGTATATNRAFGNAGTVANTKVVEFVYDGNLWYGSVTTSV